MFENMPELFCAKSLSGTPHFLPSAKQTFTVLYRKNSVHIEMQAQEVKHPPAPERGRLPKRHPRLYFGWGLTANIRRTMSG